MCVQSDLTHPSLQPLPVAERIQEEGIIGLVPFSEFSSTAALDIPSIDNLLRGPSLMMSIIEEEQLSDSALVKRISDQIGQLLGGWFAQGLAPHLQLHTSLIPLQLREYYYQVGMNITLDKPTTAFYHMAFKNSPWQVQAVGELNVFHCVSLGRLLAQDEALQEGGYPSKLPFGPIEPLLAQATPNLSLKQLVDRTAEHASNVFDAYLKGESITVKAGVRQGTLGNNSVTLGEFVYYYGIRINLDLRIP